MGLAPLVGEPVSLRMLGKADPIVCFSASVITIIVDVSEDS